MKPPPNCGVKASTIWWLHGCAPDLRREAETVRMCSLDRLTLHSSGYLF
uniref:Uncharacterized protein n=1 Tax=Physcomitrium patens TaxID=3218 RepID=A0A2K1IDM0_PHYPA|nr:hypothetical protein PHYPA_029533 [Physcomitrium patens]